MFMRKNYSYKLILSYNGTNFSGWQRQRDGYRTVQGVIEESVQKIIKTSEFNLFGSSRTDTGVHASGQVALLRVKKELNPQAFHFKLSKNLPDSIRVTCFERVDDDFNPQVDVYSKVYHYYFSLSQPVAQSAQFILQVASDLNLEEMNTCCNLLKGRHDFSNFTVASCATGNSIRDILSVGIEKVETPFDQIPFYKFSIEASGFLKYMIRNIFALILKVGEGEISVSAFENFLKTEKRIGVKKAPAKGLHLFRINYSGK